MPNATLYENGPVRSRLTTRTIALGALVAVLVGLAFLVVVASARQERRYSEAARRAEAVTTSAVAPRARGAAESREARDDADRTIAAGLAAAAAAVLLIVLWVAYETRSIVLPLRRLAAAARRMGRGDLDARVPATGRGEAREVA